MKFTTVLGSLFLAALQASAAPSSPSDSSLHPTGWCCTEIPTQDGYHAVQTYIPRGIHDYYFTVAFCKITVRRPSPNSCDGYTFEASPSNGCQLFGDVIVRPKEFCNGPADPAVHLPLS
ncbi:hypothetical protein E4U43_007103 [Claviceps pusilla]|uniref:Uncharacterized protein n=1 Tax=Claviceps pusilla TaxID=123648 RepID=A0A9P7NFF1_9HYPO|nr:hypothetical protein E4U43_007103 [Claviceps pusilla]